MAAQLERGCVFGADHDTTYKFWVSQPKWKRCLLFNLSPPGDMDDAHYFIATSGVSYFYEHPLLLPDVLIFPSGSYGFFPKETAIDFRELRVVPLKKLRQKNLRVLGYLSGADIQKCAVTADLARQLETRDKKLLGLR